jgi:hypothetical protein
MNATANMAAPLVLGAPGIYRRNDEPLRMLTNVRMDVCAFVGVAPRGPARRLVAGPRASLSSVAQLDVRRSVPLAVESWQAYVQSYGGFEGPGLLPYAVSAFFANGGQRAYIVRIVHPYLQADGTPDAAQNAAGTAHACFEGVACANGAAVWVAARNEGSWGLGLKATLRPAATVLSMGDADILPGRLRLPPGLAIPVGAVLRLTLAGAAQVLRQVVTLAGEWNPDTGRRDTWAGLDAPTPGAALSVELVEASLQVDDGAGRSETLAGIGLTAAHPRWLARVLLDESSLLYPADNPGLAPGDPGAAWLGEDLQLETALRPAGTRTFQGGADRHAGLVPDDFFDARWVPGDEDPGDGVHALVDIDDLSLLVVPDLYSPGPLAPAEPIVGAAGFAGADFAECVTPPAAPIQQQPPDDLTGLRIDPGTGLEDIIALQGKLTTLADQLRSPVVLLDVPPGLSQRRILYWRGRFDCAYAAAYHPWPYMAPQDDARQRRVAAPPSAFAAGIIAQRELQSGVAHGPANVVAAGAVGLADRVSAARHGELHQQAVNVFLQERDGVRLSAARTLSRDAAWRQLNVRRLVVMIRRALERQMQWAVFEPNNHELRALLSRMLEAYLRQLYRASAFTGATEAEAFFVRCDDTLNPPAFTDTGQLLAQVGVAPAEPMEFIVLNIARSADASLTVEA